VVLKSKEIDVMLGMDWLTRHNGVISCATKEVSLVNHEGIKAKCQTRGSKVDPMVFNLDARTIEEVPVVQEYPNVFPEELPGMPPDRDIEFIIDLIPRTAPIAKRPYKMDPSRVSCTKGAIKRVVTKRLHQTEFITLRSPSLVCEKERWKHEDVCGL
jgi:hypothetical protein